MSTWRGNGEGTIGGFCFRGGFESCFLRCRRRWWGGSRAFGLNKHQNVPLHDSFQALISLNALRVCVRLCVCTCGAGGLSICGLRICKASSRGVCFFLNFPSGLLNAATQCCQSFQGVSRTNVAPY